MNKALFLDRDGTIIRDVSLTSHGEKSGADRFVLEPDQVDLIPGAAEAIAEARQSGFKIIVVTNQSAVARGWLTETTLENIHKRMRALLIQENPSALIDDIFYCPFLEDGTVVTYRRKSPNRKPDTGMILEAQKKHALELRDSWMVGDAMTDMLCAERAGLKKVLVATGFGLETFEKCERSGPKLDHFAKDIREAFRFIQKTIGPNNGL